MAGLQNIELARISQEVTKRFYNLLAVHCPRGAIARYSFQRKMFATCKFDRCSNLASKLPVRRWRSRRFRRVPSSEPASAYQYAHGSRGGAAGVRGSAADGAV